MKIRLIALVMTAAALSGSARPVLSQIRGMPERHLVRFGLGGGVSVPTTDAADALKTGVNGQGYVLVDPGLGIPLRVNLGYQKFDYQDALLGGGATGDSQMLSGLAGLSVNVLPMGPLRPYVTGALGAFRLKETSGGVSASSTRFGIDGGAGLALKLGRMEAFVEGRVQNVYTEAGVIDAKSIRAVPVTFGLLF